MMNFNLISIIINCYNGEKYLGETIQSVLDQTFKNWELILWDNQSTDKSASIFKSYKNKKFKYFLSKKHLKLGDARNLAVKKANGNWIAFLDADDLWKKNKLEKQIKLLKKKKAGIIYCENKIIFQNNNDLNLFGKIIKNSKTIVYEGNVFNKLMLKNFIPLCSAIFLKKAFIESGGINPKYSFSEDYDFILKISKNYNVYFTKDTYSIYRVHNNNLSNKNFRKGYLESIDILSKYLPRFYSLLGIFINLFKYLASGILNKIKND